MKDTYYNAIAGVMRKIAVGRLLETVQDERNLKLQTLSYFHINIEEN